MDIEDFFPPEVAGVMIRHMLTTAGGSLVASGVIDSEQLSQGVGAVMVLLGVGWSIYQKYRARQALKAATQAAPVQSAVKTS